MTIHYPQSEDAVCEIVKNAAANGKALRILGGGTRQAIGRSIQSDETISTSKLSGISLYEASEMVISAQAGTPFSVIEAELKKNNQMFTFEPMDHRHLLGSEGEPTIGSIAAGNISGPRRIFGGAARDSLIGVRFVNGRGDIVKNGGRVMKNVTGLDLVKLQSGAWGTLGLLTEVTFKLLPRPEDEITLTLKGLSNDRGIAALCAAAGTPFEATGLAHIPAGLYEEEALTVIRVEGFRDQVEYRAKCLSDILKEYGSTDIIRGEDHDAVWQSVRDVRLLAEPRQNAIWRLSVRPSSAANIVDVVKQAADCTCYFDWCGGLIWLSVDEEDDASVETIRNAAEAGDGYATLVRGSEALRQRIDVFEPEVEALSKLSAGIKKSFDPAGVFNAGLMRP